MIVQIFAKVVGDLFAEQPSSLLELGYITPTTVLGNGA